MTQPIEPAEMPAAPGRITRVIVLAGEDEAPLLGAILRDQNPELEIIGVHDRFAVELACAASTPWTRLVSFCSSVIVPATALAALPGPAYNFHPGPPNRPGRYPSVFALYDRDPRFGITIHEMAAKVDSGPIVAAEWFDVPAQCDLRQLEILTFGRLADRFRAMANHLATTAAPLPHIDAVWSGRKTTLADVTALGRITPDMSEAEAHRRSVACGGQVTRVEG